MTLLLQKFCLNSATTFVACSSILVLNLSLTLSAPRTLAQTQFSNGSPRWYAYITDVSIKAPAAAKVVQKVVDVSVSLNDAQKRGFVAHPLWLGTGTDAWVEVGYDKEPYLSDRLSTYYWASGTPSSYTHLHKGYAVVGNYSELSIIWNKNTNFWEFHFEGQKIGEAANIGGPNNNGVGIDAGLESTSDQNLSPPAPLYGLKYATLSNWTWRDWPNPSRYEDYPARVYWVNPPFSAETRLR